MFINPSEVRKWRHKNVIEKTNIVSNYMDLRYTMFREEIIYQFHHTTDYWCRYEWKHCGSPHVHGFLCLKDAPDMETLNWKDPIEVTFAKEYFDRSVHAWNPRNAHHRNIQVRRNDDDHPCLKDTEKIFQTDPMRD